MKEKKILITGSTKGIGFAIAQKLIKNDKNFVYINGRKRVNLQKAKKKLINCSTILGDISKNILYKISKRIKNLDVLICNVGNGKSVPIGKEKVNDWKKSFEENFYSTVNTIKAFEKKLIKSKGIIVCISSICGSEYIKGAPMTYSVTKAALNAFIRSYSKFWALRSKVKRHSSRQYFI